MSDIVDGLREYLNNTPPRQVKKDWDELSQFDKVEMNLLDYNETVRSYYELIKKLRVRCEQKFIAFGVDLGTDRFENDFFIDGDYTVDTVDAKTGERTGGVMLGRAEIIMTDKEYSDYIERGCVFKQPVEPA